jgi:hypothetical protein
VGTKPINTTVNSQFNSLEANTVIIDKNKMNPAFKQGKLLVLNQMQMIKNRINNSRNRILEYSNEEREI